MFVFVVVCVLVFFVLLFLAAVMNTSHEESEREAY